LIAHFYIILKSHELVEKSFSTAMFTRNEINSIDTSRAFEQQDNFQQKQQMQQNGIGKLTNISF
jgi:hypothetical protein